MSSPLGGGGTSRRMSEEEEEPPPTSPLSRPSWRSDTVVTGGSHLLHTRGRRSGAEAAGASHLLARGRRSGAARGRRKPPVAVLDLPLRVQGVLANQC
jgi:hypothetical protein